ncbi:ATP-binding cassette domain-containing protein [Aestuariivita sp.]|jgi:peptide/nickel transport system ATP-binding protein|uniref:ATP-binding cassette domain-containing protein n=1 Tax=Aestuariivita sp. TaxID=1872407 RepID=UPI00217028CD|nr:ATP-binding cassette domain-containing protein [Aestuariivita sp.]MCE8005611.1 ABC transporter ATP-binding protein [Aestuariivita sp.]
MSALVDIRDLVVSYPDMARKPLLGAAPRNTVLHGITLAVGRGQIIGIVGESGSGKSTLGRAILRLIEPDQGQIVFDGTDITHLDDRALRALRPRFQMIFQDPMSSLNPRQTLHRLIATPLAIRGDTQAMDKAANALDRVGLPSRFLARYPHELSGGQRQRVGIARAIVQSPDFIVADEIASGLDVSSQAVVLTLLQDIVRETGTTLAFISHDLSVVRRLCDSVVVMAGGKIVEAARTTTLFNTPQSGYTRKLLEAIPLPEPDQVW